MVQTEARHASLGDLAALLKDQHARKIDVVASASKFRFENGTLVVSNVEPVLTADGVSMADGRYTPTSVFDEGISQKLGIPLPYLRRLRKERPDLYDRNANGWLHGVENEYADGQHDPRSFLIRLFKPDRDDTEGVARAFLSDRYKVIDNLDALTAALDGVRRAGTEVDIIGCDLTDRRMYVRVRAPEVQALAPVLVKGYRSPFSGASGDENPTVFAGFEISNSETGGGAFTITPRLEIQICSNGMKITKDAMRGVHLGGKQDEGVIRWSDETQEKTLDLITSKARDAVTTFVDVDYMKRVIEQAEAEAEAKVVDPVATVKVVSKALAFSEETTTGVLDHFVRGGQMTVGGVMNAVTSFAQTVQDADAAADIEAQGMRALELAAARG